MHIRSAILCGSNNSASCNTGNTIMDAIYPEPMSLLHRRVVPKKRRGKTSRYRTQPVTFSEIQEVDEDNLDETTIVQESAAAVSRSEQDINRRFEEFMKSREKILRQLDRPLPTVLDENLNVPNNNKNNEENVTTSCRSSSPTVLAQGSRFSSRPSI